MTRSFSSASSAAGTEGAAPAYAVVQNSLDGLAVLDLEGRYTLWNPAMERFAGKTADEVLGRKALEVFPFLREHGLDRALERALSGEVVATEGVEHIDGDGSRKVYDRLYMPLRSARGEIAGVIAIVRDATARYAAQDAFLKSQAKLRIAAETARVGFWSWEPASDAVEWDGTMYALFGRQPGEKPPSPEEFVRLVEPQDRAPIIERLTRWREAQIWEDEFRFVRRDGAVRWLFTKAAVLRMDGKDVVLGAALDVTERKEHDDRRRATQRLEVVGQLTAGIAHNFNNMLMTLLPNLELASKRAPVELVPLLREAERSAQRAADVIRQLMTYVGRKANTTRRPERLGALVERTVAFCRTTFDPRIELDVRCDDDAAASVDATQLEQALLNLLINARDALDDSSVEKPRIAVRAGVVPTGAHELEGRSGRWIAIRVVDNGVGMAAGVLQRLYEPFFTTKEPGKGTGLGLATTQGIVREHGGFVLCQSAPGRGATFSLYLPAVSFPADLDRQTDAQTARAAQAPIGGVRVLVVDDEEPVRRVIARVLRDEGFEVETAASGEEALGRIGDPALAASLAVVLLDVSMPGLSGPELRARLRDLLPHASVAFLTGYPYEADGRDVVLEKPLAADQLASAVRALARLR